MAAMIVIVLLTPGLAFLVFVVLSLVGHPAAFKETRPGICQGCGYDLTGNVSGVCPECGITIARS